MLHVFPVVRRVKGRQGMGRGESMAGGRGVRHARGGGLGHDGVGRMDGVGMRVACVDGDGSGVGAGLSVVRAGVRWNSSSSDVCALVFPFKESSKHNFWHS